MNKKIILCTLSFISTFSFCVQPKGYKLTLSMIVRNESGNYLREMLSKTKLYIDNAVIIDDCSTDDTVNICKEILGDMPLHIVVNNESMFSNEWTLRKKQWEETIKTNPDWIVFLDADQIFEDAFKDQVRDLINQEAIYAYYFRLYDFWNERQYRDDNCWLAHNTYRPFLVRYVPGLNYEWKQTPQHCGSFPVNIYSFPGATSHLRLKHFGWAKQEDRESKYVRYMKLDPGAKYGWAEQYESILDENPHLVDFIE